MVDWQRVRQAPAPPPGAKRQAEGSRLNPSTIFQSYKAGQPGRYRRPRLKVFKEVALYSNGDM
jgi:hypothetical protein